MRGAVSISTTVVNDAVSFVMKLRCESAVQRALRVECIYEVHQLCDVATEYTIHAANIRASVCNRMHSCYTTRTICSD